LSSGDMREWYNVLAAQGPMIYAVAVRQKILICIRGAAVLEVGKTSPRQHLHLLPNRDKVRHTIDSWPTLNNNVSGVDSRRCDCHELSYVGRLDVRQRSLGSLPGRVFDGSDFG